MEKYLWNANWEGMLWIIYTRSMVIDIAAIPAFFLAFLLYSERELQWFSVGNANVCDAINISQCRCCAINP